MIVSAADLLGISNPVDAVGIFVVPVIAQFFMNPQQYENAAGQADGKTGNVDKGIAFVFFDVS